MKGKHLYKISFHFTDCNNKSIEERNSFYILFSKIQRRSLASVREFYDLGFTPPLKRAVSNDLSVNVHNIFYCNTWWLGGSTHVQHVAKMFRNWPEMKMQREALNVEICIHIMYNLINSIITFNHNITLTHVLKYWQCLCALTWTKKHHFGTTNKKIGSLVCYFGRVLCKSVTHLCNTIFLSQIHIQYIFTYSFN